MPNHRSDIAEVRAAMRAVGYTILQVEPRLANLSNLRPDVLAWASNADGSNRVHGPGFTCVVRSPQRSSLRASSSR